jgi:hypothetical protein
MTRSRGRTALAVVFFSLGTVAWAQVVLGLVHVSGEPRALLAFQTAIGAAALAAAWGCWRTARWAPAAALAYGVVAASMLLSLASLLGLPQNARGGLWSGAALVMAFALWAAWYIGGYSRRAALGSTRDARRAGK